LKIRLALEKESLISLVKQDEVALKEIFSAEERNGEVLAEHRDGKK
jgi:hypothetical protein